MDPTLRNSLHSIVARVCQSLPRGGGAKDGESMIIMGADASGTGEEPTTRVGADGGDGRHVVERATP